MTKLTNVMGAGVSAARVTAVEQKREARSCGVRRRTCSLQKVMAVGEATTAGGRRLRCRPTHDGKAVMSGAPTAAAVQRSPTHHGEAVISGAPTAAALPAMQQAAVRQAAGAPASRPRVDVAFYRKYTEAMLRRYLRLSMEAGRVPSLLGRELFRGHVSSYRVNSFEDVVLFCIDVERCLARLDAAEQDLVRRISLQQYTQEEAAALLGRSLRSVVTAYAAVLDRLTMMLIGKRMLEPLKSCQ